ncbi:12561_t:CDS:1, partial [Racocetra persica]
MAVLNVIFVLRFIDYLLLIALAFLTHVFLFYYKYFTRSNKLPGPLPLPFIGCAYMFMSDTRKQFTSLQQKYGDI